MGTGTEGQSRIEHHVDGLGIGDLTPARADPQATAKLHRVEVIHPLTFPVLIFDLFDLMAEVRAQRRMARQLSDHLGHLGLGIEQADDVGIPPQQGLAR